MILTQRKNPVDAILDRIRAVHVSEYQRNVPGKGVVTVHEHDSKGRSPEKVAFLNKMAAAIKNDTANQGAMAKPYSNEYDSAKQNAETQTGKASEATSKAMSKGTYAHHIDAAEAHLRASALHGKAHFNASKNAEENQKIERENYHDGKAKWHLSQEEMHRQKAMQIPSEDFQGREKGFDESSK